MKTITLNLTPYQKERLARALDATEEVYDPSESMLRIPLPENATYHTTLKGGWVHPTYRSLVYALALLDSGEEGHLARATNILDRVTALQDTDSDSATYGIWSWFMDEPLEKMAPPDWNFADFCGGQLLEAVLTHRNRIDVSLCARMDAAIVHAAGSIKRRDVGPEYTNIVIMGSFVCIVAGEIYGVEELRSYGLSRFRNFYEYTQRQGAFTEYNSPTYTFIALNELGRIRSYVEDETTRKMAGELYRRGWEEIATHFHAPTKQWGGPHSRGYSVLLAPDLRGFLARATGVPFPGVPEMAELYEHRLIHQCPSDLRAHFAALQESRSFREVFSGDPGSECIGTTHLQREFTLGTINCGDLWNQRRALVAYWGNETSPKYLHLRCLHDGYDFSAAHFFSSQSEGNVLGGVTFAYDQGDTHLCLDMIRDGRIRAKDLRIRFEMGGLDEGFCPRVNSSHVSVALESMYLQLDISYASWEGRAIPWEHGFADGKAWLDLPLYSGDEREFDLPSLSSAAAIFTLRLSVGGETALPKAEVMEEGGLLQANWEGHKLVLSKVPRTLAELRSSCRAEPSETLEPSTR